MRDGHLARLLSADVYARGQKAGRVSHLYVEGDTGEPSWVAITWGVLGGRGSLIPLDRATLRGSRLEVDFDRETVRSAPRVPAGERLSPVAEMLLYEHYHVTPAAQPGRAPARLHAPDPAAGVALGHAG